MELPGRTGGPHRDVQGKQCVLEDMFDNEDLIYDDVGYGNDYEAPSTSPSVVRTQAADEATSTSTSQPNQSESKSQSNRPSCSGVCLALLGVLLLAGFIGLAVYWCCPVGWIQFGNNSCYYTSNKNTTWNESRQNCLNQKADLVTIKSQEEQTFLSGLRTAGNSSWIGLSWSATEGTWTWVDNTTLTNTTAYWAGVGQPSGGVKSCVTLSSDKNQGQWWNSTCGSSNYWICKSVLL
ncbi:hypothetical protein DPEC_G00182150 [Dallia pectoralis]|uniref:Uncharacterized protein n=1 Tax=Dallia pectoralis TaxID=75939 RepID=A0ACC2GAD3_DALPE|nr:hypothetical protein DPEC_G00182150 [Dallia pectoralis]